MYCLGFIHLLIFSFDCFTQQKFFVISYVLCYCQNNIIECKTRRFAMRQHLTFKLYHTISYRMVSSNQQGHRIIKHHEMKSEKITQTILIELRYKFSVHVRRSSRYYLLELRRFPDFNLVSSNLSF